MAEVLPSEEPPWDDLSHIIVSAAADGIVAVDDHGFVLVCNPAAERLLGRPAAELVGSHFGYPIAEGVTEIDLVLPGGRSRVVEMRVTSATWEDSHLHVASLRDVTQRRQLEQDLGAALEHQNIVVAVAAHELRNPLAAIAVLAEVLRDRRAVLTDRQRAAAADRIAERTHYLRALIAKLLSASRIDAKGPPPPPEPVALFEFLLERLAEMALGEFDVRLSCDPELEALVNRGELAEMVTNYLENALAYGRPPIEIRASLRDSHVEVRVCDSGPGVPATFVPHLFDRFTRAPAARRDKDGTGLGLWIVRTLAEANGGEAWYEPGGKGGACFCLRLSAPAGTRPGSTG